MARNLDPFSMAGLLRNFSKQIEDALRMGEAISPKDLPAGPLEKIVFAGLGGSAIGGDVIRSLWAEKSPLPIWVSRHYALPSFVDSKTLCIFSSYSGNTEETISSFHEGMKKGLKSIVITSGGELARLSKAFSVPLIQIPQGFPPRTALGYSVFPILKLFSKLNLCPWDSEAAAETVELLRNLGEKKYAPEVPLRSNPARKLARALWNRFVVIYAGTELLDSAALRLRNQIEENSKALASHHLIPEMNHNEILGWQFPKRIIPRCACIFLKDSNDHPRIQLRMKITKKVIQKAGAPILEIESQGKSSLARLFSVIHLGDWVSYYLALLYQIDPTPVPTIGYLKDQLAKIKL